MLFKKIALLIEQGEHLTVYGIQAIINIRASLNLGLFGSIKSSFPLYYSIYSTSQHYQSRNTTFGMDVRELLLDKVVSLLKSIKVEIKP